MRAIYIFQGAASNSNLTKSVTDFIKVIKPAASTKTNYANWWKRAQNVALEPIYPTPVFYPTNSTDGGLPSVLISREIMASGLWAADVKARVRGCITKRKWNSCMSLQMYQDITGNVGSPQNSNVAISDGFRTALIHYVVPFADSSEVQKLYSLGSNSYFSESAYNIDNYAERYWGSKFS